MLVDTAGAYPGNSASEQGQSEAIAKNLQEFAALRTPTISVVIGKGAVVARLLSLWLIGLL